MDPAIHGEWGAPFVHDITTNFPCHPLPNDPAKVFNAVHMIAIAKPGLQGRVFVMDQAPPVQAPLQAQQRYALIDTSTNPPTFTNMCMTLPGGNKQRAGFPPPSGDFFCSHHVQTRDGNVIFFGGTIYVENPIPPQKEIDGSKLVYVWSPSTTSGSGWFQQTSLHQGRYYPTVTVGEILPLDHERYYVAGGLDLSTSYPNLPSTYESYQWTPTSMVHDFHIGGRLYAGPVQAPPPNESGTFYWYPHNFLMTNGLFFTAAFALNSGKARHDPTLADPGWNYTAGTYQIQGYFRHYAASVLLPIDLSNPSQTSNQVVRFGGGLTYGPSELNPVATAEIQFANAAVGGAWVNLVGLTVERMHGNAVLLMDGTTLVLGGIRTYGPPHVLNTDSEIVNLVANTRTKTPPMDARGYHSTAVLLDDGRVLYGGGSGHGNDRLSDYQIYSPPYLFKGSRPVITAVNPTVLSYGQGGSGEYALTFSYQPPSETPNDYVAKVVLIRPGSTTHHFDSEQRYLQLDLVTGVETPPNTMLFKAPPNGNYAPPGWYRLVILTTTGIPSVATWVRVLP